MRIFLDNFFQRVKYTAQIAIHQAELRRVGKVTDKIYLSIIYLQNDYLNLDIRSGSGRNNWRANIVKTKCTFGGGANYSADFSMDKKQ